MRRFGIGWVLSAAVLATACVGDIGSTPDGPKGTPPAPNPTEETDHAPSPLVIRLNDRQYRYSVEDVLGVALTPDEVDEVPRDIPSEAHYSTNAEGQFFNTQYVIAYAEVARSVTDRLAPSQLLQDFGDCSEQTEACRNAFITGLGLRLHRRPLTDEEALAYAGLALQVEDDPNASFDDGVVAITQAMLQSPAFLYRLEDEITGEADSLRWVDGYELASRLSYFLWQSIPDEELLAFAATVPEGGVVDDAALAAQVERMMADPKYARSRRMFWSDYTLASTATFSFADATVADELRESMLTTMDRLSGVDNEAGPITGMFDTDRLWMTPAVAQLAGASNTKDGMAEYGSAELDDQRTGITTHPGFLGAIGTTSFVGRGVFMSQRLLCIDIISPPSDEDSFNRIQETAAETEELTPREASEFRFNLEPACQGCHQIFEPIAYAYERYDVGGSYALQDGDGRDLYSDGTLPALEGQPEIVFENVNEMMTELAATPRVGRCLVQNMLEYATGHDAGEARVAMDAAYGTFVEQQETFDALVRAVATSPQLRVQRVMP